MTRLLAVALTLAGGSHLGAADGPTPVVGVGLKYFNTGVWGPDAQASNNAINNELAESGLIGAAGWITMHAALLVMLFRRRSALASVALAVLAGRILHGQLDIYWSAGVASLAMLVAGMAFASTDPSRAASEMQK